MHSNGSRPNLHRHISSGRKNAILYFFRHSAEWIAVTTLVECLVAFFLYRCRAEGYSVVLLIWIAISSAVLYGATRTSETYHRSKMACKIMAALLILGGGFFLLLQLCAAQRSFAESWLERARNGAPNGFFSFFAGEIYAFLLFLGIYFFSTRRYGTAICLFPGITALAIGIISDIQILLILALVLIFVPILWKKRWQTFISPAICAALLSALLVFSGLPNKMGIFSSGILNISKVVSQLFPSFPLLVSMPGYGTSVQSERPLSSVALSARPVFKVQGSPLETIYLTTGQYISWNGDHWTNNRRTAIQPSMRLYYGDERPDSDFYNSGRRMISLYLLDDYYPVVPCTTHTFALALPESYRNDTATEYVPSVLAIEGGIQRDTELLLFTYSGKDAETVLPALCTIQQLEENAMQNTVISPRIKNLSQTLYSQASAVGTTEAEKTRCYIELVLDYLKTGFSYSLNTPQAPDGQDPFEYFLFESKVGFCSWYAGSFTLLMHAAKVPCRSVSGFRATLDQTGRGVITGLHSHAWPEVFIDGQWRIFEATPIYTVDNPFEYLQESDRQAARQLSLFFGKQEQSETDNSVSRLFNKSLLLIFPLLILIVIIVRLIQCYSTSERRFISRARLTVKMFHHKGVPLPSEIGWLAWKDDVRNSSHTEKDSVTIAKALQVADEMIVYLYTKR